MSSSHPLYTKLDETILEDHQIEDLMEESGVATFGVYVGILTLFRRYENKNFAIPFSELKKIGKKKFNLSQKQIEKHVDYLVEKGFFHTFENINGELCIYSRRRQSELFAWQELKQKQSESADNTNKKLGRGRFKKE